MVSYRIVSRMSLTLVTTSGSLKIELYCELCPITSGCANFLGLAASDYYDGKLFHRNIAGFLIQGGSLHGNGKGGISIYGSDKDGYFQDEFHPTLQHSRRGIVAMANKSRAHTNLSQFYICYDKQSQLNNINTVFGCVIDGWDTLDIIEKVGVDERDRPVKPIVIEKIH